MRLTIEIPDEEVLRLVEPISKALRGQSPGRPEVELRLLRVEEVAKALGVARATVYQLCQSGELPAVRIGRRVGVTTEARRQYLSSSTIRAEPAPSSPAPRKPAGHEWTAPKPVDRVANRAPNRAAPRKRRVPKASPDDLVDVADFAEIVDCTDEAVRGLFTGDHFPVSRSGGRLVARRGDLLHWIEADRDGWAAFVDANSRRGRGRL